MKKLMNYSKYLDLFLSENIGKEYDESLPENNNFLMTKRFYYKKYRNRMEDLLNIDKYSNFITKMSDDSIINKNEYYTVDYYVNYIISYLEYFMEENMYSVYNKNVLALIGFNYCYKTLPDEIKNSQIYEKIVNRLKEVFGNEYGEFWVITDINKVIENEDKKNKDYLNLSDEELDKLRHKDFSLFMYNLAYEIDKAKIKRDFVRAYKLKNKFKKNIKGDKMRYQKLLNFYIKSSGLGNLRLFSNNDIDIDKWSDFIIDFIVNYVKSNSKSNLSKSNLARVAYQICYNKYIPNNVKRSKDFNKVLLKVKYNLEPKYGNFLDFDFEFFAKDELKEYNKDSIDKKFNKLENIKYILTLLRRYELASENNDLTEKMNIYNLLKKINDKIKLN